MLSIENILALSAAGYTKDEINALATASDNVQSEEQPKREEPKKEQTSSFAEQLSAQLANINERLNALAASQPKAQTKPDNSDMMALLQSMNVNAQRYDLPPQYDVQKKLDNYFAEMVGGSVENGGKK